MTNQELPQDWLFTFGPDHLHPETNMSLGRNYVRVHGTCDGTRAAMLAAFGRNWAFQYTVEMFGDDAAQYNLIEIPMPAAKP